LTAIAWTKGTTAHTTVFVENDEYTFTATVTPKTGYTLTGMTGSFSHQYAKTNGVVWTVATAKVVINFTGAAPSGTNPGGSEYTVTINEGGNGVSGAGSYLGGATVNVNAGTKEGFTFSAWTAQGYDIPAAYINIATFSFPMPENNVTLTATWTAASVPGQEIDVAFGPGTSSSQWIVSATEYAKLTANPGGTLKVEVQIANDKTNFAGGNMNGNNGTGGLAGGGSADANKRVVVEKPILPILSLDALPWANDPLLIELFENATLIKLTVIPGIATVNISAIDGVDVPVAGEAAKTDITATTQFTGTVDWSPALVSGNFGNGQVYTATITLTAEDQFKFAGVAANFFKVEGAATTNLVDSGIVTAVFPTTGGATGSEILIPLTALLGIPVPEFGGAPVTTVTHTEHDFTYGSIVWIYVDSTPMGTTFVVGKDITATITLTAKTGFKFTGFTGNITCFGSTSVNYTIPTPTTLTIVIGFPELEADVVKPVLFLDENGGGPKILAKSGIAFTAGTAYEMVAQHKRVRASGGWTALAKFIDDGGSNEGNIDSKGIDWWNNATLESGNGSVSSGAFQFSVGSSNDWVTTVFQFTAKETKTLFLYLQGNGEPCLFNYIAIREVGGTTNLFTNGVFESVTQAGPYFSQPGWILNANQGARPPGWENPFANEVAPSPFKRIAAPDKWWYASGVTAPNPPAWVKPN
jgi:uncharacterized repeat protein (TIGR02543 family)